MIRQMLKIFAVTVAFVGVAVVTALLLRMPTEVIPFYLEVTVLAGLVVDGLRYAGSKFWHRNRQLEHDLEDIFRSSLA